jgi:hypothetical protein
VLTYTTQMRTLLFFLNLFFLEKKKKSQPAKDARCRGQVSHVQPYSSFYFPCKFFLKISRTHSSCAHFIRAIWNLTWDNRNRTCGVWNITEVSPVISLETFKRSLVTSVNSLASSENIHLWHLRIHLWHLRIHLWHPRIHMWRLRIHLWHLGSHSYNACNLICDIWNLNCNMWRLKYHLWHSRSVSLLTFGISPVAF